MKVTVFFALWFAASALAEPYAWLQWTADVQRPAPFRADVFRGDTVGLRCALKSFGGAVPLPEGCACRIWWQTNGMDRLWWSAPAAARTNGVLEAAWTPGMDPGGDRVQFFIAPSAGTQTLYRAFGELSIRPAPGASPNALPFPVQVLDFGAVAVTNAPWVTPAQLAAATNGLSSGGGGVAEEADPVALPLLAAHTNRADNPHGVTAAQTGALTNEDVFLSWAASNRVHTLSGGMYDALTAGGYRVEMDGHTNGSRLVLVGASPNYYGAETLFPNDTGQGTFWEGTNDFFGCLTRLGTNEVPSMTHTNLYLRFSKRVFGNSINGTYTLFPVNDGFPRFYAHGIVSSGKHYFGGWAAYDFERLSTNISLAAFNGPSSGIKVSRIASEEDLAPVAASASNALFIAQTYMLASNAWMTVSNSVLTLYTLDASGGTGAVVWASSQVEGPVDAAATNALWLALSANSSVLSSKADKDWGKYLPSGAANPDPAYQTMIDSPALVLASGCSWQTSGSYAVLTASGTVAFNTGTNGTLRIGPDGTNWFGYVQGGSVTIGAAVNSFSVEGSGTDAVARITYDYAGGDFPVLWFATSLSLGDWTVLGSDKTTWVDNQDGTATVQAYAGAASGFYKATTSASLGTVFNSAMPARFEGGIYGSQSAAPVKYDSTIEVTSGAHTYRIPAQLVQ